MDNATSHKPKFVRVLIGCTDVERIPPVAKGCLGDNFYDLCYEVEKVVVAGPPRNDETTRVGNTSRPPSPKRYRTHYHGSNTKDTSKGVVQGIHTESVKKGTTFETIQEHELVEQESEEDSIIGV
jgi:hypothetical protein